MSNIIQFHVSRDQDGVYTADGVNVPVVTEGASFEELQENIQEAVELYFQGENPDTLGFARHPAILTSFELPAIDYGVKA